MIPVPGLIVVDDAEPLAWVMAAAADAPADSPASGLDDEHLVAILESNARYEQSHRCHRIAAGGPAIR